jgi:tetratricopeptide (TPR) repeat protein
MNQGDDSPPLTIDESLLRRAHRAFERGLYETAIAECTKALRANPRSSLAYFQRACAALALGRWEDAVADSEEALELGEGNRDLAHIMWADAVRLDAISQGGKFRRFGKGWKIQR